MSRLLPAREPSDPCAGNRCAKKPSKCGPQQIVFVKFRREPPQVRSGGALLGLGVWRRRVGYGGRVCGQQLIEKQFVSSGIAYFP